MLKCESSKLKKSLFYKILLRFYRKIWIVFENVYLLGILWQFISKKTKRFMDVFYEYLLVFPTELFTTSRSSITIL